MSLPAEEIADMSYSIDTTTDGCYLGTTCLVNKLGILAETEAAVVMGKAMAERNASFSLSGFAALDTILT